LLLLTIEAPNLIILSGLSTECTQLIKQAFSCINNDAAAMLERVAVVTSTDVKILFIFLLENWPRGLLGLHQRY
jgi:hypothetical protein